MIYSGNEPIQNAYILWENYHEIEDPQKTVLKFTEKLFKWAQGSPFLGWLFPAFAKELLQKEVVKALSAYKFDLIQDDKFKKRLHLFSEKEKWFFDKNLTGILRNILIKPTAKDKKRLKARILNSEILEKKAKRWNEKINKYFKKEYFMVANSLIYISTFKLPKLTWLINKSKTIGKSKIESEAASLAQLDPSIFEGIKKMLEDPNFTPKKTKFNTLAKKVVEAKAERLIGHMKTNLWNGMIYCKDLGLHLLYEAAQKMLSLTCSLPRLMSQAIGWQGLGGAKSSGLKDCTPSNIGKEADFRKQHCPLQGLQSSAIPAAFRGLQQESFPGFQSP